jgi:hypothetical protein
VLYSAIRLGAPFCDTVSIGFCCGFYVAAACVGLFARVQKIYPDGKGKAGLHGRDNAWITGAKGVIYSTIVVFKERHIAKQLRYSQIISGNNARVNYLLLLSAGSLQPGLDSR